MHIMKEHNTTNSAHANHKQGSLRKATAKHALRCLIGCNVGESLGVIIGLLLGFDMYTTMGLAITLAFAVGYAFTMIPMLKTMPIRQAAKVTVLGDTSSIASMEFVEISLAFAIPGFIHATLVDAIFWIGLGIILPAGFLVSYPIMYLAMKREQQKNQMMQQMHHH